MLALNSVTTVQLLFIIHFTKHESLHLKVTSASLLYVVSWSLCANSPRHQNRTDNNEILKMQLYPSAYIRFATPRLLLGDHFSIFQ